MSLHCCGLVNFACQRLQDKAGSTSKDATSSYKIAIGTTYYESPERWTSQGQPDAPPADIYAFAMVMTWCITGKLVLPEHVDWGPTNKARRISGCDTNWVSRVTSGERPELPVEARDLSTYKDSIEKCWNQDPRRRPSSAAVAEEHLGRLKQLRYPAGVPQSPVWPQKGAAIEAEFENGFGSQPAASSASLLDRGIKESAPKQ
eukprot:6484664-Amphidinium_carterae.1